MKVKQNKSRKSARIKVRLGLRSAALLLWPKKGKTRRLKKVA